MRRTALATMLTLVTTAFVGCGSQGLRKFTDRPVAWDEHDEVDVPVAPDGRRWDKRRLSHGMMELVRDTSRGLSLPTARAADDVNAMDEVPCSTWYCARNHLEEPLPVDAAAAGPSLVAPPVLPLRVLEAKDTGVALGFTAIDASGAKFILKFDPTGFLGLQTGAEIVGARLFHLLGYHVPDAFIVNLRDQDLVADAKATRKVRGEREPLSTEEVRELTRRVARAPGGKLRAVAIAFLPGKILGGFQFEGRTKSDPNDRIPHERRRSLRASYVMYSWLGYFDAGPSNTVSAYVSEDDRRFVRHYIVDFGSSLGAATTREKYPAEGTEHYFEVERFFAALGTAGIYQRDWQHEREAWERNHTLPALGYFPYEGWDPSRYRSSLPNAAHDAMTERDAYWAAKVVTSVTDEQIRALVTVAGYDADTAEYLARALSSRRDAIGRRYLTRVTAIEAPEPAPHGRLCFEDLAVRRGAAREEDISYRVRVEDDDGTLLLETSARPRGPRGCVTVGNDAGGGGYRVVTITSIVAGREAKPAHVHLVYRPAERRVVVVGLERDE